MPCVFAFAIAIAIVVTFGVVAPNANADVGDGFFDADVVLNAFYVAAYVDADDASADRCKNAECCSPSCWCIYCCCCCISN